MEKENSFMYDHPIIFVFIVVLISGIIFNLLIHVITIPQRNFCKDNNYINYDTPFEGNCNDTAKDYIACYNITEIHKNGFFIENRIDCKAFKMGD